MNIEQFEADSLCKWRTAGFIGVFLAVIAIFFIAPIFANSPYSHLALQCCFILMILSIVYTLKTHNGYWIPVLFMAACFLFLSLKGIALNDLNSLIAAYSIYAVFTVLAIIILIRKVFCAPSVDTNLIFGALTVYLLTGILWAKLFLIEALLFPGSFKGTPELTAPQIDFSEIYEMQFNLLYYSFTTLATLGIGDISPHHHFAKSLTVMEAVAGQLFVAIVIAKLVSVWRNKHFISP